MEDKTKITISRPSYDRMMSQLESYRILAEEVSDMIKKGLDTALEEMGGEYDDNMHWIKVSLYELDFLDKELDA